LELGIGLRFAAVGTAAMQGRYVGLGGALALLESAIVLSAARTGLEHVTVQCDTVLPAALFLHSFQ